MPLYEYECAKCGEKLEVIRSFSDPPLTVCPECGGALVKLLSPPAIQFKGSGFYLTDYGKSGSAQAGEKEKRSAGKSEEAKDRGESKGDATADSKGDSKAGETAETKKREDSSKGKKDGSEGANAAPSSPTATPSPAPSKKKNRGAK
ncbi:MAG TPA: FmdB family zinc ribbon protein [Thermoanaerobaculia bacterium]|nr:FmdB family zinc ribbon protein [Thermoanaerobaculia bacterium]